MQNKKIKIFLAILMFFIVVLIAQNVEASELNLNELKFEAQINWDSSMDVTEYWDIKIEDTNTLYKFFKDDDTKFSGITNVKVTDITNGMEVELIEDDQWQYHVTKGHYYGTDNEENNFEIGWGVGLDDKTAKRKYKIEYTVEDAIAKYNDYAELYWQFIGNGFEIPAKKVIGVIKLPEKAEKKEDIKVWGHTEELNGEIYVTSRDTIEFVINSYNSGKMVEVRTLFPSDMIVVAERGKNKNILDDVIEEETKWAEEANRRRERQKTISLLVVGIPSIIIDVILLFQINRYIKKRKELGEKIKPEQQLEYYRDIPGQDPTPGEAYVLLNKIIGNIPGTQLGKIFASCLLDLNLKGFIQFEVNQDAKKENEKISIRITNSNNSESNLLTAEERCIYEFISNVKDIENGITVKQLQKYIEKNASKVEKLTEKINSQLQYEMKQKKLIDGNAKKMYTDYQSHFIIYGILIYFMLIFGGIVISSFAVNTFLKVLVAITFTLPIITMISLTKTIKHINVFTQKGVNQREEWNGLKKYMMDYSLLNEKEVPSIAVWEKYLVYATTFGIADKVIKQLKIVYPEFESISQINSTTLYIAMNTNFDSSFSRAISSSMSTATSSSSGGGGGFSGGGGGGGGRRWRRRSLI